MPSRRKQNEKESQEKKKQPALHKLQSVDVVQKKPRLNRDAFKLKSSGEELLGKS